MSENKPSILFWIIAILALLWNAIGVIAFTSASLTPYETLLEAYGQDYADIFSEKPIWAKGGFFLAVAAGFLGAVCLIMRRKWAYYLFVMSFVGMIIHHCWEHFSGIRAVMSQFEAYMSVAIFLIAIFLLIWSYIYFKNGILR